MTICLADGCQIVLTDVARKARCQNRRRPASFDGMNVEIALIELPTLVVRSDIGDRAAVWAPRDIALRRLILRQLR